MVAGVEKGLVKVYSSATTARQEREHELEQRQRRCRRQAQQQQQFDESSATWPSCEIKNQEDGRRF